VHLLPVFDLASVPEAGCITPRAQRRRGRRPRHPAGRREAASADADCFNWGYDPLHFNAPEGSYASDAADGAVRIASSASMVHGAARAPACAWAWTWSTTTPRPAARTRKSVLDRIVPGYYHRLNARARRAQHLLRQHRHRAPDDGQADDRLGAVLWAREYRSTRSAST
jgi:pullulanase